MCFGCLTNDSSYEVLASINKFGTDWGAPTEELRIVDCGVAYPLPKKEKPPPIVEKGDKGTKSKEGKGSGGSGSLEAKKEKTKGKNNKEASTAAASGPPPRAAAAHH